MRRLLRHIGLAPTVCGGVRCLCLGLIENNIAIRYYRVAILVMIQSFGDRDTRDLYAGISCRRWMNIEPSAMRKLVMLDHAKDLADLRIPPSNRLKPLKGDLAGYHSIRINDQFRVMFIWRDGHAHHVRIVDYH